MSRSARLLAGEKLDSASRRSRLAGTRRLIAGRLDALIASRSRELLCGFVGLYLGKRSKCLLGNGLGGLMGLGASRSCPRLTPLGRSRPW